ncbi:MAG: HAMP domain-containing sensor histidine kinase, partial [Nannocystaceae bacterium]
MAESFAVLCDDEGRVVEALRVGAGLGPIRVGDDLRDHFHASARGKVAALLAALRREGHAFGWELLVALDGEIVPFQVAGAALPEGVLVLAHRSQAELVRLLEDLQGNERAQTCELRRVLDELRGRRASLDDASVFAEMSRLNNELATTQRELIRRSTHLEELVRDKNELLGMVAHDLRNPLTAIFGLAEHLLVDPDHALSASQREAVEHIRASSDHMRNLVEELLDFAAFEAGTITLTCSSTDLVALARRTVRLCRELARAKGVGIELEVVDPDALGLAAVDGPKIAQALVNLITNAIKFSRPGGAIEVRLRRESEGAVFEVEDHGVGIAADELPGLFTAFGPG